ncbi:MAG: 30S ribosomal protein S16 [Verrucomicrobia bacterium]|nr:30S ribosomal protein S16 [Verrucomicrobiota bacterium]
MALRIKLARGGSAHNPVYRIVVGEARVKRDGNFVEWIGTYSPKAARGRLKINLDRADYWMGVGAKPTDTVRSLINKARREPAVEEVAAPAPVVKAAAPVAVVEEAAPVAVEEAPVVEEAVVEETPIVEEVPAAEEVATPFEAEASAEEAVVEEAPEKATEAAAAEEETPAAEEEKKDA